MKTFQFFLKKQFFKTFWVRQIFKPQPSIFYPFPGKQTPLPITTTTWVINGSNECQLWALPTHLQIWNIIKLKFLPSTVEYHLGPISRCPRSKIGLLEGQAWIQSLRTNIKLAFIFRVLGVLYILATCTINTLGDDDYGFKPNY